MNIEVTINGSRQMKAKINSMAVRAEHVDPALKKVLIYIFTINRKMFDSQGRRLGGQWKRLTDDWKFRKKREHLDPKILRANLYLMKSVTQFNARYQKVQIANGTLTLTSTLPYARVHQKGYPPRKIPARPYIKVSPNDRKVMRAILTEHILAGMENQKARQSAARAAARRLR